MGIKQSKDDLGDNRANYNRIHYCHLIKIKRLKVYMYDDKIFTFTPTIYKFGGILD